MNNVIPLMKLEKESVEGSETDAPPWDTTEDKEAERELQKQMEINRRNKQRETEDRNRRNNDVSRNYQLRKRKR